MYKQSDRDCHHAVGHCFASPLPVPGAETPFSNHSHRLVISNFHIDPLWARVSSHSSSIDSSRNYRRESAQVVSSHICTHTQLLCNTLLTEEKEEAVSIFVRHRSNQQLITSVHVCAILSGPPGNRDRYNCCRCCCCALPFPG